MDAQLEGVSSAPPTKMQPGSLLYPHAEQIASASSSSSRCIGEATAVDITAKTHPRSGSSRHSKADKPKQYQRVHTTAREPCLAIVPCKHNRSIIVAYRLFCFCTEPAFDSSSNSACPVSCTIYSSCRRSMFSFHSLSCIWASGTGISVLQPQALCL